MHTNSKKSVFFFFICYAKLLLFISFCLPVHANWNFCFFFFGYFVQSFSVSVTLILLFLSGATTTSAQQIQEHVYIIKRYHWKSKIVAWKMTRRNKRIFKWGFAACNHTNVVSSMRIMLRWIFCDILGLHPQKSFISMYSRNVYTSPSHFIDILMLIFHAEHSIAHTFVLVYSCSRADIYFVRSKQFFSSLLYIFGPTPFHSHSPPPLFQFCLLRCLADISF